VLYLLCCQNDRFSACYDVYPQTFSNTQHLASRATLSHSDQRFTSNNFCSRSPAQWDGVVFLLKQGCKLRQCSVLSCKGPSGESISTAILAGLISPNGEVICTSTASRHCSPSNQILSAAPGGMFHGGLPHGAEWGGCDRADLFVQNLELKGQNPFLC